MNYKKMKKMFPAALFAGLIFAGSCLVSADDMSVPNDTGQPGITVDAETGPGTPTDLPPSQEQGMQNEVPDVTPVTPPQEVQNPVPDVTPVTPPQEIQEPASDVTPVTPPQEVQEPASDVTPVTPPQEVQEPASDVTPVTPPQEVQEPAASGTESPADPAQPAADTTDPQSGDNDSDLQNVDAAIDSPNGGTDDASNGAGDASIQPDDANTQTDGTDGTNTQPDSTVVADTQADDVIDTDAQADDTIDADTQADDAIDADTQVNESADDDAFLAAAPRMRIMKAAPRMLSAAAPQSAAVTTSSATPKTTAAATTASTTAAKAPASTAAAKKTAAATTAKTAAKAPASSASKQLVPNGVYSFLSALNPFKAIDIYGGSKADRANAQAFDLNNTNAQHFQITYHPEDGTYSIMNVQSGKYLDVYGGFNADGTNVHQFTGNNTRAQRWVIKQLPNGNYTFLSALGNHERALDLAGGASANGTNLQIFLANGTPAQQFRLQAYNPSLRTSVGDGVYVLQSGIKANGSAVVDITGASMANGANAQLFSANGTAAQQFAVTYTGGAFRIMSCSSGRVLTLKDGRAVNGGNVMQDQTTGAASQKWQIMDAGDGTVYIKSVLGDVYLDIAGGLSANGTNVQVYAGNGTKAQRFRLQKQTSGPVANGVYFIENAAIPSMTMDIWSGSKKVSGNAQIFQKNGTGAQKFQITRGSDGLYTIVNCNSGHALDIAGGSTANGANLQQFARNGTLAQKWIPRLNGDGTLLLINAGSGKVLDITAGKIANGSNIQQFEYNGTNAQKFRLEKTTGTVTKNINYSVETANQRMTQQAAAPRVPAPNTGTLTGNLQKFMSVARSWIGRNTDDGSHRQIIDIYNSVQPLPLGYPVKYTDDWCDTFVSAVGIAAGVSNLIGRECGVERHVGIFQNMGIWNENGSSTPQTGDLIVFSWGGSQPNNGFSDHIGIVESVSGNTITTIEGNSSPRGRNDPDELSYVTRQAVRVGEGDIRGYARPRY